MRTTVSAIEGMVRLSGRGVYSSCLDLSRSIMTAKILIKKVKQEEISVRRVGISISLGICLCLLQRRALGVGFEVPAL